MRKQPFLYGTEVSLRDEGILVTTAFLIKNKYQNDIHDENKKKRRYCKDTEKEIQEL